MKSKPVLFAIFALLTIAGIAYLWKDKTPETVAPPAIVAETPTLAPAQEEAAPAAPAVESLGSASSGRGL